MVEHSRSSAIDGSMSHLVNESDVTHINATTVDVTNHGRGADVTDGFD